MHADRTEHDRYECPACEGTGKTDDGEDCDACDGIGVTHIDCASCGVKVASHESVFVAAQGQTYCEPCGDAALHRIAARRGQEKW